MGSLNHQSSSYMAREQLLKRFLFVRKKTERLCEPLSHEDFVLSATEDTSPPKWHLAHTSWFFENFILSRQIPGYEPFKPEYNFLFNSYYRRVGNFISKNKRSLISRPTIDEVLTYRKIITDLT